MDKLVERVAQFRRDVEVMRIVVDVLASIGDSCEAPIAIQARDNLARLARFPGVMLDAIAEPSEGQITAAQQADTGQGRNRGAIVGRYRAMIAALRQEIEE
jgi:hypothetical protein